MNTVRIIRDRNLNKITFYLNGKQVFPKKISGNIYTFENGQNITL